MFKSIFVPAVVLAFSKIMIPPVKLNAPNKVTSNEPVPVSPFPSVARVIVPPEIFIPDGILPGFKLPPAEFSNLPAGDYIITAGTDRNDDGDACGLGDLCGAFPVRIAPRSVAVDEGESVTNMDFSVSRRLLRTVITQTNIDGDGG